MEYKKPHFDNLGESVDEDKVLAEKYASPAAEGSPKDGYTPLLNRRIRESYKQQPYTSMFRIRLESNSGGQLPIKKIVFNMKKNKVEEGPKNV